MALPCQLDNNGVTCFIDRPRRDTVIRLLERFTTEQITTDDMLELWPLYSNGRCRESRNVKKLRAKWQEPPFPPSFADDPEDEAIFGICQLLNEMEDCYIDAESLDCRDEEILATIAMCQRFLRTDLAFPMRSAEECEAVRSQIKRIWSPGKGAVRKKTKLRLSVLFNPLAWYRALRDDLGGWLEERRQPRVKRWPYIVSPYLFPEYTWPERFFVWRDEDPSEQEDCWPFPPEVCRDSELRARYGVDP